MAICRVTFSDGDSVDVEGDLQTVMDELHKVYTRREHTFAVMREPSGQPLALRPEAVLHVRPVAEQNASLPG